MSEETSSPGPAGADSTDGAAREKPQRTAINRPSLHDRLVGRLRDMIIEGDLIPGTRVPERLLCEQFGISRTPLREALKVLASEGLLELLPHRGATVARLTVEAVEEMFEVMEALETLAGELACARISDERIAEIRAWHYQMLLHYERRELPEYFKLNQAIHEGIIEAANNSVLSATYASLSGRIRRARYVANLSQARWDQAVQEHEQILEALSRRDGAALSAILQRHLRNKCEVAKAVVAKQESAAAAE